MALSIKDRKERSRQSKQQDAKLLDAPDAGESVTIQFASEFIAQRVKPEYEKIRETQDKVRKRIAYAIKNRRLTLNLKRLLCFWDLISWAITKKPWRSALQGLPFHNSASAQIVAPAYSLQASGHALPSTIEECHRHIMELHHRILVLSKEAEAMIDELKILRPIGIADKNSRRKKSTAGKRGGRPSNK